MGLIGCPYICSGYATLGTMPVGRGNPLPSGHIATAAPPVDESPAESPEPSTPLVDAGVPVVEVDAPVVDVLPSPASDGDEYPPHASAHSPATMSGPTPLPKIMGRAYPTAVTARRRRSHRRAFARSRQPSGKATRFSPAPVMSE